jgi:hypothetical protein
LYTPFATTLPPNFSADCTGAQLCVDVDELPVEEDVPDVEVPLDPELPDEPLDDPLEDPLPPLLWATVILTVPKSRIKKPNIAGRLKLPTRRLPVSRPVGILFRDSDRIVFLRSIQWIDSLGGRSVFVCSNLSRLLSS